MKKILVIEDEPEMRRNLATILRLENFQPLTAENGRAGLESVRTNKPDLILCDVMMPELDGFGLLRELRANQSTHTIPVILLSGYADTLALEHRVPEADAVLHKGRSREVRELLETAEQLLRRRKRKPMGKAARSAAAKPKAAGRIKRS